MSLQSPIVCLAGPTASGKSAATLALAKRWPIEIINVDSATIYRGMDIGTAKPSADEQRIAPHHLLDIRDPAQSYSAAQFCSDAIGLIKSIQNRDRIPLLCGGTMMYYKALREGLNTLPSANADIRQSIEAQANRRGWPAMHKTLAEIDPITAKRLAPNDSQRIQRAIEVYQITGQPLSELISRNRPGQTTDFNYITISLEPSDRAGLHTRIENRYRNMIDAGLVAEVEVLFNRGDLHTGLPSVRCVGYRQIWAYLEGETSLETAIERAIAATRQLAKRQITWLRAQPDRHTIDCLSDSAVDQILALIPQYWQKKIS